VDVVDPIPLDRCGLPAQWTSLRGLFSHLLLRATETAEGILNTSLVPDDLAGARGILNGTVLSLPLWGLILALWHLLTSGGGYPSSTDLRSLAQHGRTRPEGQFSNAKCRRSSSLSSCVIHRSNTTPHEQATVSR
jgi:hypothetical protein